MNFSVLPNLTKPGARKCTENIIKKLKSMKAKVLMQQQMENIFSASGAAFFSDIDVLIQNSDAVITVGGDGTIIHAAKYAAKYDKPILGVNLGRVGFVASLEKDQIHQLELLIQGKYRVSERAMLEVKVSREQGEKTFFALNDAVIARDSIAKVTDFYVLYQGKEFCYRADGLIFATPTGSTAYSLSAGGPIIDPDIRCILFSQICPYSLVPRPVLFSHKSRLQVQTGKREKEPKEDIKQGLAIYEHGVRTGREEDVWLIIDGKHSYKLTGEETTAIKLSNSRVKIIYLHEYNFYDTINQKFGC